MAASLKIRYPFKPYKLTQAWGNPNPAYSEQFGDPNFKRHNGIDANIGKHNWDGSVVSEYPVYCPVEGFTVRSVDFAPQGGGNELWLMSNDPIQMGDKVCHAWMPLCHAKKILVSAGYQPALGELLMIADNTGFSTGVHTHMGLYRVEFTNATIHELDQNDATNSYDPAEFFTNTYAVDEASVATLVKSGLRYYQYVLTGN